MKRLLTALLAFGMIFCLLGCEKKILWQRANSEIIK